MKKNTNWYKWEVLALLLLGVLDDVAVAAWIYNKIGDSITPAIERKVEETLDKWFGPEIISGFVADLSTE